PAAQADTLEVADQRLAIDPCDEPSRAADQMHDAGLDHRLGEYRLDRLREAFSARRSTPGSVLHPAVLELDDSLEPELGPFVGLDPQPQPFLLALEADA